MEIAIDFYFAYWLPACFHGYPFGFITNGSDIKTLG